MHNNRRSDNYREATNSALQRGQINVLPWLIFTTDCRDLCPHSGQITVIFDELLNNFITLFKNDIGNTCPNEYVSAYHQLSKKHSNKEQLNIGRCMVVIPSLKKELPLMTYSSGLRQFKERPVEVKCPECSRITNQKSRQLRRDKPLKCSYCGHIFLPSECSCIGG